MSLLDPRVWLGALLGLVLAYMGGRWQQSAHDEAIYATERTKVALSAAVDQVKAADRARAEEQRRTTAQTEIANAATKDLDKTRRDARAAGDAAERLRVRVAELLAASRAGSNSASASPSAPASPPDTLLAELFRRADERAGSLAEDLDAARVAGLACERSYDTLSLRP